jgi:NitT/TauT family transport system substrate-binding protein
MLALATVGVLMACGTTTGGTTTGGSQHRMTVGLAYVPNIQFAPLYVALSLNYYRDAGLDVTLRHHSFTEDEFGAIATGREDAIFAGGDEMLQARDHAIPLVDVVNLFSQYPIAVIAAADSAVRSPSDLRGRIIGTPGPFGETYFGLLAILQSVGLKTSDATIQYIQFTQVAALTGHKVDAVTGYLNNESIQFRKAGFPVRTMPLSAFVQPLPLVSNGLGVPASALARRPGDVRALVSATLRGMDYARAHPQQAVDISKKYVPGLEDPANAAAALDVLQATIPLWTGGAGSGRPGYHDPTTWRDMAAFMRSHALLSQPLDATAAYSNDYLPGR